jgi:hypothetical protein
MEGAEVLGDTGIESVTSLSCSTVLLSYRVNAPGIAAAFLLYPLHDPVPLEYSIVRLICAVTCSREAVMVGWPGAAQDRLLAGSQGTGPGRRGVSAGTWPRMLSCWCSGTRTQCCVGTARGSRTRRPTGCGSQHWRG